MKMKIIYNLISFKKTSLNLLVNLTSKMYKLMYKIK